MADRAAKDKHEIEITPAMIEAGIEFLVGEALNTVSYRATSPEFVVDFYKAVVRGGRVRNSLDRDLTD